MPHTSTLSAAGFPALWLHRPSSSPASSAFWSSSAIVRGLLPLFSPKSFILSRAIYFLSFPYAMAELCTAWESCPPESLFAVEPDGKFFRQVWQRFAACESPALQSPCLLPVLIEKCSSGFCLASLTGGVHCWPTFPSSETAWPHQLGPSTGNIPVTVCRSLVLHYLFCVFWWANRLCLYKKNNCVLFQTSFWCLLTTGWLQESSLWPRIAHGLG